MWEGSRLRSTDVPSHGRQGPLTGGLKKRAGSFLTSPLAQNDASKDYEKSSGVLRSSSEDWPRTSPKAQMIPSDGFATERSIWLA